MNRTAPQHWKSHVGPSNWYRIWYPPTWEFSDIGGSALLSAGDGAATLTLHCFLVSDWKDRDLESAIHLGRLFAKRRNVRAMKSLNVPYESVGFEGEAIVSRGTRWWTRLWGMRPWRHWRLWAVRQDAVCLVAIYLQSRQRDPEGETIARMILNTLQMADHPADPPTVFAHRALELARKKFPLLTCQLSEDFQLQLGESRVNLFNFYRSYVNEPDRFDDIMLPALTTVVQVQEWGEAQTDPPLKQVQQRILPMLYPESVWRECFPNFVARPWVADLMILYVVDESQAYWYIRDDLLQSWNLSRDELHNLAMENLAAYFEKEPVEFMLSGEDHGPKLLIPSRPDAYNTSRLLCEPFYFRLRELLGREFAVGIPNRDFFVAVSLDSDSMVEQIRRKVETDYHQMDHPLSDRLLLVSADGISEYLQD